MKTKAALVARLLLGLIFFAFGLNGFLQFMPMPPMPEGPAAFMGALANTGYMFPLIKGVEVVGGLMLLAGAWVPLALVILAPNIVNIFLFHAFLAPSGMPMAIALAAFELFLIWTHWGVFAPLFKRK